MIPEMKEALRASGKWNEGEDLKLHLGCGEAIFDGYINIDYPQSAHVVMKVRPDFEADITRLVFSRGSVQEIRLHHVFEHFNRVTALALLIQWHEFLKTGGELVIETPDFEASVRDFLSASTLEEKMRAIRHLEGDQADGWAYHVGQWFPSRLRTTLERLGFADVEIVQSPSCHTPPLFNVTARARKRQDLSRDALFANACELLKQSTVAEAEAPTLKVWVDQLAMALDSRIYPGPGPSMS